MQLSIASSLFVTGETDPTATYPGNFSKIFFIALDDCFRSNMAGGYPKKNRCERKQSKENVTQVSLKCFWTRVGESFFKFGLVLSEIIRKFCKNVGTYIPQTPTPPWGMGHVPSDRNLEISQASDVVASWAIMD